MIDGARFLRAIALGYDIGTRFTITLGKLEYMVASHRSTHALAGLFGSAAAAGCAASLNTEQMQWLLSYAAQQASGLASWQRDTDHIEKAFDSQACPHAAASRLRSWFMPAPPEWMTSCPVQIISSRLSAQ